jgi:ribose 5-phosphate isomerase A
LSRPSYLPGGSDDPSIQAVARKAIGLVPPGSRVGLGSGRAASAFITELGARVRAGLRISAVPTSRASGELARLAGIPLFELGSDEPLDITVDGADEVAPNLDLLKGWGGALVQERIVAAASACQIILVGQEKLVRALGERGPLPVEVIPDSESLASRKLKALGLTPTRRIDAGGSGPFVTESGNLILDCALPEPLADGKAARDLQRAILAIAGVVDTGLFLGTADRVLVGHPDGQVDTLSRPRR